MSSIIIEEIKSKLDILEIIGEYVQLKKAGSSFVAPCPFHHEKTPSFNVSPDRQVWHCFGCNEGGDVFTFLMKINSIEFKDALKILAERTGVKLSEDYQKNYSQEETLRLINLWTAKFFHAMLLKSPSASMARDYVVKRGLLPATIDDFMIGYAPDSWDALINFLHQKGFLNKDLIAAGVATQKSAGNGIFSRFRHRLTFPISDHLGHIIGFTSRILLSVDGSEAKEAKYINTSETLIYKKGLVLYGFDKARRAIKEADLAVLVEGNMDVIASHQVGVKNVVASSGTALTIDQLHILRRVTDKLVLSFDGDAAGEKAAEKAIDMALKNDFSIKMLMLPEGAGKDPDDCIRQSPDLWRFAIASAVPHFEWYINIAQKRFDLSNIDGKKEAGVFLMKEVAKFNDPVSLAHWVNRLSDLLGTPANLIFEQVETLKKANQANLRLANSGFKPKVARSVDNFITNLNREDTLAEHIVGLLMNWPNLFLGLNLAGLGEFDDVDTNTLYKLALMYYRDLDIQATRQPFFAWLTNQPQKVPPKITRLSMIAQKEYGTFNEVERKNVLTQLISEYIKTRVNKQRLEIKAQMLDAEKNQDLDLIQKIQKKFSEL